MNDVEQVVQAAFHGKLQELETLLEATNDIDQIGRNWNPLHAAIENEQLSCVKVIVNHGANVEKVVGGMTPLEHAVDISIDGTIQSGGNQDEEPTEMIEFLLKAGANPIPGLKIATKYNSKKIIALLQSYIEKNE